MRKKSNYFEQVQAYLADEMQPNQREDFEAELSQNNSLKRELTLQKKINTIVMDDELQEFKHQLDEIHQEISITGNKKINIRFGRYALIAACFLVLIALSIFFVANVLGSSKSERLFNKYYKNYTPDYTTRSSNHGIDSQFAIAFDKYKLMDFHNAKTLFEMAVKSEQENFAAKFYLGATYLEINEIDSAIQQFDAVIKSHDQYYLEHAEWYKALSLLKKGMHKKALDQFQSIASRAGYYSQQAEEIISQLQ